MKRTLIILIFAALLASSCDKSLTECKTPEVEISLGENHVFTNEQVKFSFSGDANFISFYSGEKGNSYEYIAKDREYVGVPYFSFKTAVQTGTQWARQADPDVDLKPLSVFYSTDFYGNYTPEGIANATWIDITDKFAFPLSTVASGQAKNATAATPSGDKNLYELLPEDVLKGNVYFAYRYHMIPQSQAARCRIGVHQTSIVARCEEEALEKTLVKHSEFGFKMVKTAGYDACQETYMPQVFGAYLWLDSDDIIDEVRECWAVSSPIKVSGNINVGCDYAISVKSFADEPIKTYSHTYSKPGEYKAVFRMANVNAAGLRKEQIKEFTIIVLEGGESTIVPPTNEEW